MCLYDYIALQTWSKKPPAPVRMRFRIARWPMRPHLNARSGRDA